MRNRQGEVGPQVTVAACVIRFWMSPLMKITPRGTLRGRMPLASVSLSWRALAFAQLVLHIASSLTVPVVHGMQEVSGSSPLSSTQVKCIIRIQTGERVPCEGILRGKIHRTMAV